MRQQASDSERHAHTHAVTIHQIRAFTAVKRPGHLGPRGSSNPAPTDARRPTHTHSGKARDTRAGATHGRIEFWANLRPAVPALGMPRRRERCPRHLRHDRATQRCSRPSRTAPPRHSHGQIPAPPPPPPPPKPM
eukprot:758481-Prymnesium_polylepis.1